MILPFAIANSIDHYEYTVSDVTIEKFKFYVYAYYASS